MQHGRLLAHAALFSIAFATLTASALPVNERWSPIANSAVPAQGPLTTLVRGDASQYEMTVRWNCGQPSSCTYTGLQNVLNPMTNIMIVPNDIGAPGRLFMFGTHNLCASYGANAQIGVWLASGGEPVVQQCFLPTETRYMTRADAPPPVRIARVQLPSNIAELTASADARERARPRTTP